MEVKKVVDYMLKTVVNRPEILNLVFDRGLEEGMQIEKWILTEMLARLIKLSKKCKLGKVEGEHKYNEKFMEKERKIPRFEHCDLWWYDGEQEHWLEVKTIVIGNNNRGKYSDITTDIEKANRMKSQGIFHHLTFLFTDNKEINDTDLKQAYKGFTEDKEIQDEIREYKIGTNKNLRVVLYNHKGTQI